MRGDSDPRRSGTTHKHTFLRTFKYNLGGTFAIRWYPIVSLTEECERSLVIISWCNLYVIFVKVFQLSRHLPSVIVVRDQLLWDLVKDGLCQSIETLVVTKTNKLGNVTTLLCLWVVLVKKLHSSEVCVANSNYYNG